MFLRLLPCGYWQYFRNGFGYVRFCGSRCQDLTARNQGNGAANEATTNESGFFTFSNPVAGDYTAPAKGTFAPGDTRNIFNNPGFWQWNLAAHKTSPIKELVHLEFRAETFNLTNHPNWGSVNSNPLGSR